MSRMKPQGRAAEFACPEATCAAHLFVYAATHIVSLRPPDCGALRGGGGSVAGKSRHLERFSRAVVESRCVAQALL
jgi:hypothetical protein